MPAFFICFPSGSSRAADARNSTTGKNGTGARLLTIPVRYPNILLCRGSTPPPWSDVAVSMRLGRPTGPGGLGPADDAHAQEGGGPVIEGKHGSVEVASS